MKNRKPRQLAAVFSLMSDGGWRTLREIAVRIGGVPEASVSARLRDIRKAGLTVLRRRTAIPQARVFEYRVYA